MKTNKPEMQAEYQEAGYIIRNWPTEPTQADMLMYEFNQKGKPK